MDSYVINVANVANVNKDSNTLLQIGFISHLATSVLFLTPISRWLLLLVISGFWLVRFSSFTCNDGWVLLECPPRNAHLP